MKHKGMTIIHQHTVLVSLLLFHSLFVQNLHRSSNKPITDQLFHLKQKFNKFEPFWSQLSWIRVCLSFGVCAQNIWKNLHDLWRINACTVTLGFILSVFQDFCFFFFFLFLVPEHVLTPHPSQVKSRQCQTWRRVEFFCKQAASHFHLK